MTTKHVVETYANPVATAVHSAENIQNILCSIVENVTKEVRAKGCSLALLTPDGKFLRHMASYGLSEKYVRKGRIQVDRSMSEALNGNPVAVIDATIDARVQYRKQAEQEGIVSIVSVPVMYEKEILGVMRVYTAQPRRFTEEDIRFICTAASLGAKALENAVDGYIPEGDYDAFRQQLLELEWARWPGQCI